MTEMHIVSNFATAAVIPVWLTWVVWGVIFVASIAIPLLLAKSNSDGRPDPATLDDFPFPTSTEDRAVTQYYGTIRAEPNCLGWGRLTSKGIYIQVGGGGFGKGSRKQLTGFAYHLSMLWAIGAPVDAIAAFRRNKETEWEGDLTESGGTFAAQTGEAATMNGSKTGPSTIQFFNGTQEALPAEVVAHLGDEVPYRGYSLLWMNQAFVGDNATSVQPFDVVVRRIPSHINPAYAEIGDGQANPADVICDLWLTDPEIGTSRIDWSAMGAVQQSLYHEGLGVSFAKATTRPNQEWVEEVLRHIDGVVRQDPETGLWGVRLIRDDYDVNNLVELSALDYQGLDFRRKAWSDTVSDLYVKWTSPRTWELTGSALRNPATRAVLGYKVTDTLSFPYFTTSAAVQQTMARVQRRHFYPLASMKFTVSQTATWPVPGDVYLLSNAKLGISGMVIRVVGVSGGGSGNTSIDVEAVEDLFGLGNVEIRGLPESEYIGPDYRLENPVRWPVVKDAPAELDEGGYMIVATAVAPSTGTTSAFRFDVNGTHDVMLEYSGSGTLASAISEDFPLLDVEDDGILIEGAVNIPATVNSSGAWQRMHTVVMVDGGGEDWELWSVRWIDAVSEGVVRLRGILRDIAGTGRRGYAEGTRIYVLPRPGNELVGVSIYGEPLAVPLNCGFTAVNYRRSGARLSVDHTYGFRAERPYPPSNLSAARDGSDVTISWVACSRLRGISNTDINSQLVYDREGEGSWEVTASDGWGPVYVDEPTVTRTGIGAERTYTVRSLLDGRFSAGREIVI